MNIFKRIIGSFLCIIQIFWIIPGMISSLIGWWGYWIVTGKENYLQTNIPFMIMGFPLWIGGKYKIFKR